MHTEKDLGGWWREQADVTSQIPVHCEYIQTSCWSPEMPGNEDRKRVVLKSKEPIYVCGPELRCQELEGLSIEPQLH